MVLWGFLCTYKFFTNIHIIAANILLVKRTGSDSQDTMTYNFFTYIYNLYTFGVVVFIHDIGRNSKPHYVVRILTFY